MKEKRSDPGVRLTPGRPIADGIRFCEMTLFEEPIQAMLAARGLIWLTDWEDGTMEMGGSVIAASRDQAAAIADARGLGERVVGQMSGGSMHYLP